GVPARALLGPPRRGHRQRERELHRPITHPIAVGADRLRRPLLGLGRRHDRRIVPGGPRGRQTGRLWEARRHLWNGRFEPEGKAGGRVTSVSPMLTGTTFEALGAEKCIVKDLGWTARPGEATASDRAPPSSSSYRTAPRRARGRCAIRRRA